MKKKIIFIFFIVLLISFIATSSIYKKQKYIAEKIEYEEVVNVEINNKETENSVKKLNNIEIKDNVKESQVVSLGEFRLTAHERWIVECMVMGESGGEPYEGQMLVAQCILNACLKDDITPSEVKKKYKYSGWNESPNDSVKKAVISVFDLGEKVTNEPILYFYAPSLCQSVWHETQIFVIECGGHRFFKEK